MITRIIIEHFKSIEYCDLTLGPVNIFVGPNGSGKSNIVDAISFLKDAIEHGLDYAFRERLGYESVRQWPSSPEARTRIEISTQGQNSCEKYCICLSFSDKCWVVSREDARVYFDYANMEVGAVALERKGDEAHAFADGLIYIPEYIRGRKEHYKNIDSNKLAIGDARHSEKHRIADFLSTTFCSVYSAFLKFSVFPNNLRHPQKKRLNKMFDENGDSLYSNLLDINELREGPRAQGKIHDALRLLMSQFSGLRIEELGGFLVPLFEVKSPNGGNGPSGTHTFNVAQVSDGTLRALGLLTVLYHPGRPNMIALEEPEQMLHPGALAVLAEAIKESSETSQIFITTHSPDLIDHFEPESVFAVEMVDGVTKVSGVSQAQVTSVREGLFSLGEMMSMEGIMRDEAAPTSAPAEGDHA